MQLLMGLQSQKQRGGKRNTLAPPFLLTSNLLLAQPRVGKGSEGTWGKQAQNGPEEGVR